MTPLVAVMPRPNELPTADGIVWGTRADTRACEFSLCPVPYFVDETECPQGTGERVLKGHVHDGETDLPWRLGMRCMSSHWKELQAIYV